MKNLPLVIVILIMLFGVDLIGSLALVGLFHLLFHTIFTIKFVVVFTVVVFALQAIFLILAYRC